MFMLMPFRPITNGRLRRARFFALGVFLVALVIYGFTALHYAFPGHSAALITFASGLNVIEVPDRPLLRLLGSFMVSLRFASLSFRLNLCSAVAAALTLAWLYKIVWFFVFENMREESAVTIAPRASVFGALVAVLAVGTNIAFWYGATRLNSGIFDVAMIIGCIHMICVYGRSEKIFWPALIGLVAGVCAAESALFIAASPLIIVIFVVTEWKQSWYRMNRLSMSAFIAFVSFALTHWLAARTFLLDSGETLSRGAVLQVIVSVFRTQLAYFSTILPRISWFLVLAFGVGFAVVTFFIIQRSLDNRRTWMLFVVQLILSSLSIVIIFNLPISVWSITTRSGVIPVFSSMLAATAVALLVVAWKAQAVMKDPRDEMGPIEADDGYADEAVPYGKKPVIYNCMRVCGVFIAPLLIVLIFVGSLLNLRALLRDDGSFIDAAAQYVVKNLGERKWVVGNGLMDNHILIAAEQAGKDINLLAPYRVRDKYYSRNLCRVVQEDTSFSDKEKEWAVNLIKYNLHMFINDFFSVQQNSETKAVCMGLPDIWYDSGKVPVPELLFYGGADASSDIDGKKLFARHNEFFASYPDLNAMNSENFSKLTRGYISALRKHLAFVANNLGVTLDGLDMQKEAFAAYEKALELYPGNVSALLNRFELVSRGLYPEKRDLVEKQLNERIRNIKNKYPLWALNRYFGYVRNYKLFVSMGWEWAVSSSPGSVLAGMRRTYAVEKDSARRRNLTAVMAAVYEMKGDTEKSRSYYKELIAADPRNAVALSGLVRLSLRDGGVEEARKILDLGVKNGVSARNMRKDWAAIYLMSGDLSMARTTLQTMADEPDADPMTIAMLAMVMIEQGEFAVVESKVLPRLVKKEKSSDNYFVLVIEGRIYQMKGKKWFPKARKKFQRAFAIRPDVVVLRDIIFRLDVAMEDRLAAEAHAVEILRVDPDHAFANFFMGSVALEEGDYGRAEGYLKRAAEAPEPTVDALNNYAQLLCRIKRTDEAVKVARRAVTLAPERYEVWSTLSYILLDTGDLKEASRALAKASSLNKTDKRLFIIDGLIALKRGDVVSVKRAVDALKGDEDNLPVTSLRDLQKLKDSLNR